MTTPDERHAIGAERDHELVRALIDSLQDMVFTTDVDGRVTGVYGHAFHEAGLREEDYLGLTPMEVHGKESAALHEQAIATLQEGRPVRYEWPKGDAIYQTSATPRFDDDGRIIGFVAVRSDVTELRQRDRQARAQRRALEAAANGIVITDADGTVQWANRAVEDLTGYRPDELIGDNPRILKSGRQSDAFYRDLWQTISAGEVWQGDIVNRRKDGSLYTEEMTVTPVFDREGRIEQYVAIKDDVTKERDAIAALKRSQAWWRAVLENGSEFVAVVDADGTFTYVSPSSSKILGLDPEDLVGTAASDQVHPDDVSRMQAAFETIARGDSAPVLELRWQHADGSWRVLEAQGSSALDEAAVAGIVINARDVTERVAMQDALDEQQMLLEMAGDVARLGGWSVDLVQQTITWTDMVYEIHEEPLDMMPTVERGISYYAPGSRERITEVFTAAVTEGIPYDEELEIITARGRRVWVRTTGVAVHDDDGRVVEVRGAFQDIDVRKRAELRAAELELRLRTALDSIQDAFVTVDANFLVGFANQAATEIADLAPSEILGATIWDVFPRILETVPVEAFRRDGQVTSSSTSVVFDSGLHRWFEVRIDPVHHGIAIVLRDVTGQQEMLEHLRAQETRLQSALLDRQALVNSLPANIAVLDTEGTILDVNEQWREFGRNHGLRYPASGVGHNYLSICEAATGRDAADATAAAQGIREILRGESSEFSLEYACRSPDYDRWFRVVVSPISGKAAGSTGAVVMHVDITDRKLAELELSRLAYEDQLTGALTRTGFARALSDILSERGWPAGGIVAALDLQDFRGVNDAHGYLIGDQLLAAVVSRLRAFVGEAGLVGRTGGDAFVVYLPPDSESADARPMPAFTALLEAPFEFDGIAIRISARFGTTTLGRIERSAEELIREADVALYAGDHANTGHVHAYTVELDRRARAHSELVRELRTAVENRQFTLHVQPKVHLDTGMLVAGEALIRWEHPERGLVSPGAFIPAAEQSGLIVPIGQWVLREACHALRRWQDDGLDIVRIAVNVSVEQFSSGRFPQEVREVLSDFDVDPSGLTLEITESLFVKESAKMRQDLIELHEMGVRLALDDFGKGFSSLGTLNQYAFDEIKIDRMFVQDVHEKEYSRKVVETIIGIAKSIGAETIAEGIESREQADALLALGCKIGQGYFYSMPLDEEDFRWLLERRSPLPVETHR